MSRAWYGSSSTRARPESSAGARRRASIASATSLSRKTRSTTSATPRASSGSTHCACASPPGATDGEAAASLVRAALRLEPTHHDPVERLGMLDIGEMAGVGDLLVAAARNQPGEAPVLARRCAGILGAAHNQGRDAQRPELTSEVKIHD